LIDFFPHPAENISIETSRLSVNGCKFRPMLRTHDV